MYTRMGCINATNVQNEHYALHRNTHTFYFTHSQAVFSIFELQRRLCLIVEFCLPELNLKLGVAICICKKRKNSNKILNVNETEKCGVDGRGDTAVCDGICKWKHKIAVGRCAPTEHITIAFVYILSFTGYCT